LSVETLWECDNTQFELSSCSPICGDEKTIITGECDAGSAAGCLSDCSGVHPCYSCVVGTISTPAVCTNVCVDTSLGSPTGGWSCFEGKCIYMCGDGAVAEAEVCDDGTNDGMGCTNNC
jgi:hypothetical protein